MRRITLSEHATTRAQLSPWEARALAASKLRLNVTPVGADEYEISASHFVGSDAVHGLLHVDVLPKLPVERLYFLLTYAPDAIEFSSWSRKEESSGAVVALHAAFARAVTDALAAGLLRDYLDAEAELPFVRGKISINELITQRFMVFPPIPCAFDDYTADIESNRRLLAALVIASSVDCAVKGAAGRLRAATAILEPFVKRVAYVAPITPLDLGLVVDKQLGAAGEAYRGAVRLAELIINSSSVEHQPGDHPSLSVVLDMNRVFERFVSRALRSELGVDIPHWLEQSTVPLDYGNSLFGRPDVVWSRPGDRPVVIDAKWKRTASGEASDIQQISTYCAAIAAPLGVLIYGDATQPRAYEMRGSRARVNVIGLDVSGEIADVKAAVKAVAGKILTASP